MRHLDLFSGIGGFALAASWVWGAEHEIHSFVEIEPFCQKVLKKHWPDVPIHNDIRSFLCGFSDDVDAEVITGEHCSTLKTAPVDLLTGGFPCQDISLAGIGGGISGERSGLWKEMFRIIRTVRPRYVLIENSPALLIRGGTEVLADLASIGMDAQWQTVTAKEMGAPHRRERLYIVAYSNILDGQERVGNIFKWASKICKKGSTERFEIWLQTPDTNHRVDDGVSSKSYRLAVGAYGNAIVPQVVVPIMQAIKTIEGSNKPLNLTA